jgi:hypothetical protein
MVVVVECKARTRGAWVVRLAEPAWDDDLWTVISTPGLAQDMERLAKITTAVLPLARIGDPIPIAVIEAVEAVDRDSAYGAISQAVSAAQGWADRARERTIVLPVVVVDAPLYTLTFGNDGTTAITEVPFSRVPAPTPTPTGQTAVEIITTTALPERVGRLAAELDWLARKLLEAGVGSVS